VFCLRDNNIDDEFNNNNDEEPEHKVADDIGESPGPTKTWIIEWKRALGKGASDERNDYAEALKLFNEKTNSGIDAILYEIQRSPVDSSIIKKTPILNSVKARQRREDDRANNNKVKPARIRPRISGKVGNLKLRIILLITVIGVLVLVISLITALTNRGGIIINPHATISLTDTNTMVAVATRQSYETYLVSNMHLWR
jgi:hypothetical protein